jgi:hypothetical protein
MLDRACVNVVRGNGPANRLKGTVVGDKMFGLGRNDARDFVKCGAGKDRVVADKVDRVTKDCEQVKRK